MSSTADRQHRPPSFSVITSKTFSGTGFDSGQVDDDDDTAGRPPWFFEFVSCSICNHDLEEALAKSPPERFWMTECGHFLCDRHEHQPNVCTLCQATQVQVYRLTHDLNPVLRIWFRNATRSIMSSVQTAAFQTTEMARSIRKLREQVAIQNDALQSAHTEVQAARQATNRWKAAQEEIHSLRARLAEYERERNPVRPLTSVPSSLYGLADARPNLSDRTERANSRPTHERPTIHSESSHSPRGSRQANGTAVQRLSLPPVRSNGSDGHDSASVLDRTRSRMSSAMKLRHKLTPYEYTHPHVASTTPSPRTLKVGPRPLQKSLSVSKQGRYQDDLMPPPARIPATGELATGISRPSSTPFHSSQREVRNNPTTVYPLDAFDRNTGRSGVMSHAPTPSRTRHHHLSTPTTGIVNRAPFVPARRGF